MTILIDAITQGLVIGAVYALMTLGLAVVHSVTGVLNFSHGHLVVLSMYLAYLANEHLGLDPYVSAIIVVPLMFGIGVVLYLLIFRRLAGRPVLTAIQATLGLVFLIEGLVLITMGAQFYRAHTAIDGNSWSIGSVHLLATDGIAFIVALLASAILFVVLQRTAYGRSIRAVLQNDKGAQLVGVNIGRTRILTFGLGVALAAVAGILLLPGTAIHPSQGLSFTVVAVLAFFVGGPGNLLGAFAGALLLGLAESLGAIYLPGSYGFMLPYIIVIVVILLRPQGLFAKKEAAR